MFNKLTCVHIAVKNIDSAAKDFSVYFGLEMSKKEELPALGIRNALFSIGDASIELIEPIDHEQGPLAQFLQNRGEGMYMMAWEVENLDEAILELQKKGVRLINAETEARARGAVVFIHPKSAHGVMIELLERQK